MPRVLSPEGRLRQAEANLCVAAMVLGLAAALLTLGCAQHGATPVSPTLTYVPAPTATPVPSPAATPESTVEQFLLLPDAEISIIGSTLVYDGVINQESYNRLRRILRTMDADGTVIRIFQIKSNGGESRSAKKMGAWIHNENISVVVDEYCFSACANYIFTAGRSKVIRENSIVGWHGSLLAAEYIAKELGITLDEQLRRGYDSGPRPPGVSFATFKDMILEEAEEEREFLRKIGVNAELAIYGFLPEHHEAYHRDASHHYSVWTFSIEDMEKFGVANVSYQGDGEYPTKAGLDKYKGDIVLLEAE